MYLVMVDFPPPSGERLPLTIPVCVSSEKAVAEAAKQAIRSDPRRFIDIALPTGGAQWMAAHLSGIDVAIFEVESLDDLEPLDETMEIEPNTVMRVIRRGMAIKPTRD